PEMHPRVPRQGEDIQYCHFFHPSCSHQVQVMMYEGPAIPYGYSKYAYCLATRPLTSPPDTQNRVVVQQTPASEQETNLACPAMGSADHELPPFPHIAGRDHPRISISADVGQVNQRRGAQ